MKVHVEPITHIPHQRRLVFAAVQLEPPKLQFTGKKVYEWDATRREKRIDDAKRILNALYSTQVARNPDVIIFPEYSLPIELHEDGFLQGVANQRECIIVAGSYHETRRGEDKLFRNNVCKIYIPGRPEALILCKREASPEEKEVEALDTNKDKHNVARLVWAPEGAKDPAGINIFLCRDYLTPFAETNIPLEHGEGQETKRVSVLDWDHDGINVVVMNNKNPTLFEAAAAFDVRLLHGNQKLVLLVNASNTEDKLATALFGPTGDPERVRDVAARMPPAQQGVLLVETTLWKTFATKTFPDTVTTYPISYRGSYRYNADSSPTLTELKKEQDIPHQRGVFHPALLQVLYKYLVLEMFVARSTKKVNDAFAAEKVRHVSAAHVRGIEDVLIKKYVEHHTWVGGELPGLSIPHCYLGDKDFNEAFDNEQQTPHLKVLLRPEHFIKFRTKEVPQLSKDEWTKTCGEISRICSRRGALREIIDIANGVSVSPEAEARYRSVFSLGKEDVLPIGREFNSQIRETYFLVQTETKQAERFMDHIRDKLLIDERVRDICKIDFTYIRPEPSRRGPWFEYLLRLKCTVFEADDVLEGIHRWAGTTGVKVGTRSYDLWSYISRDSLNSIEDSISAAELRFLRDLFDLDNDSSSAVLPVELRQRMASIIERRADELRYAPTDERDSLEKYLRNFYHYVCLFNIVATNEEKNKYQASCAHCWNELYGYIERGTHSLWTHVLGLEDDADSHDILAALAKRLGNPKVLNETNLVRSLAQNYDAAQGQKSGPLARALRESLDNKVTPLRNETAHHKVNLWKKRITLDGEQFGQLEELDLRGGDICRMIVAIARELNQRGLD